MDRKGTMYELFPKVWEVSQKTVAPVHAHSTGYGPCVRPTEINGFAALCCSHSFQPHWSPTQWIGSAGSNKDRFKSTNTPSFQNWATNVQYKGAEHPPSWPVLHSHRIMDGSCISFSGVLAVREQHSWHLWFTFQPQLHCLMPQTAETNLQGDLFKVIFWTSCDQVYR